MRAPVVPTVPKIEMMPPSTQSILKTIWRVSLLNLICAIKMIQKRMVSLTMVPVLIFWMRPLMVWISMMFLIIPTALCTISKKFFLAIARFGFPFSTSSLFVFFGAYLSSGSLSIASGFSLSSRHSTICSELHFLKAGSSFSDSSSVFFSESLSLKWRGISSISYSMVCSCSRRYLPRSIFWQECGMMRKMPLTRYLFLSDGLTFSSASMALSGQMGSSSGLVSSLRKRKASKNQKSQMRSKMERCSRFSCRRSGSSSMSPRSVWRCTTLRAQKKQQRRAEAKAAMVRMSKTASAKRARERRLNAFSWFYVIIIKMNTQYINKDSLAGHSLLVSY